ncbi:MAG: PQQ-binding-like beta-propeller repeat protein [Alphaproteobacteria bacterium]|nr:PQQ-binding-like beta-propeller repeat protein [Alphaproteobacteria bacterium]
MRYAMYVAALLASTAVIPAFAQMSDGDWPSYNRTLTSERFSPLTAITPANAARMHKVCSYDLGRQTSFQTGPIVVGGTMYVTTDFDTIALDAGNCSVKWRRTETYKPAGPLQVNRGAAFLDGRIFRGTQDGRVLAYDAASGKPIWERAIADPKLGETVPAAPIAWDGLVFVGNAGGDIKGVKGRMYALDAKTGDIRWEFFLVPKDPNDVARGPAAPATPELEHRLAETWGNAEGVPVSGGATWTSYTLDPATGLLYVPGGNPAPDFVAELRPGSNLFANSVVVLDARTGAYKRHMPMALHDYHDWDVSATPALFTSKAGAKLLATAGKDGHLYVNSQDDGRQLHRTPVTTIENPTKPLTAAGTHFCPGTQGGTEWNGPAYSPATNLIYTGAVDWCSTVRVAPADQVRSVALGQSWSGAADTTQKPFGKFDPPEQWAGWIYANDADSGQTRWRHKTKAPILGAVTATEGGLVFAGDMAGTLVALDATSGKQVWSTDTGGAIGGGVISYDAGGKQRIAVASGMVSPIWPTSKVNATVIVYGVE